jgi:hypothetical protein
MKNWLTLALGTALLVTTAASSLHPGPPATDWTPLLDSKLSKWRTYESHRHVPGDKGRPPTDAQGKALAPIGYDKNEANVFSVVQQQGQPVLRISGEIYGCLFTKQEFDNYDLKLKVKWGTKKWQPRLNEPRDSGILYNSQGEPGVDYWHSWMLSQEFQVSEVDKANAMGDFWCIANSSADIHATYNASKDTLKFSPSAAIVRMGNGSNGFCQASARYQPAADGWTELELLNVNGQSIHLVDGHVVMAVSNSAYLANGQRLPLTKGKIQLQSEAAEVFYKDITIRPLAALPAQYAQYFN